MKDVLTRLQFAACSALSQFIADMRGGGGFMRKLNSFGLTGSALALATGIGLLAIFGPAARAQENGITPTEISIGAIGALTGPLAFIGAPGRDSMTMAFDEINTQGGICGRKLHLDFEHASSPAESIAAVKKLVEEDKVFILVLASGSTGAAAAADYVRQVGVPTYNLYGSTPIIRNPFAKNVFNGAVVPVEVSASALLSMFYDGGYTPKKFGILAGTYAFPQVTLKAAEDILKKKGADFSVEQFDIAARDFTSQLVSLQRQNVDSVLVLGSFSEAGFAIKQAREMGMTNVRWVVDGSAVSSAIVPILGNADGIRGYYNAPAFPGQTAVTREFEARLKKFLGGSLPQGRPSIYDLIGYGSGYVLAEAVKATDCKLTRDNVIDAWSNLKDASPKVLGGLDVTFPESYTLTDHQGVYRIGAAIVKDGHWEVYRVIDKP
jgi:branched-chain amino acid transport system substrate-binding protein